jgi:protein-S-isoprenylcysteine O-methyltransferase Ste14
VDFSVLRAHFLGWLVKGFFLPLMFVYFTGQVSVTHRLWLALSPSDFMSCFEFLFELAFFVDLVFTTMGYLLTLRLADAHLRWAEPTLGGWIAALICYQPFYNFFTAQYFDYKGGVTWGPWLAGHPAAKVFWGSSILFCIAVYAWATVTFGCRFSNLTHRGILTNGPYRFTKHPAYIAKNISWWLIAIPFIGQDWESSLRRCALLVLVNLLYYARARTEENHLSRDPVYVQYAAWIRAHGVFCWLGRRQRAPRAA